METQEIETELREQGMPVRKVYRMRRAKTLLLLKIRSEIRLKLLQQIKVVNYTRVS